MKIYGTYQRLAIAGLILGAFLLLVYNYFQILSLEGQPLKGHSPTIKQMESNLAKLDGLLSEESTLIAQSRLFGNFFDRYKQKKKESPSTRVVSPAEKTHSPVKAVEKVILPELGGIVEINGIDGRLRYKALIDGGIYRVEDRVRQYVVKQITGSGVVLQHGQRRWFVKNTQPRFSNDIGE